MNTWRTIAKGCDQDPLGTGSWRRTKRLLWASSGKAVSLTIGPQWKPGDATPGAFDTKNGMSALGHSSHSLPPNETDDALALTCSDYCAFLARDALAQELQVLALDQAAENTVTGANLQQVQSQWTSGVKAVCGLPPATRTIPGLCIS